MNLVERCFAELTYRKLRRCVHEVEKDIHAWINERKKGALSPFVWSKTADEILETFATYCNRFN